jgi:hypothetical protein
LLPPIAWTARLASAWDALRSSAMFDGQSRSESNLTASTRLGPWCLQIATLCLDRVLRFTMYLLTVSPYGAFKDDEFT